MGYFDSYTSNHKEENDMNKNKAILAGRVAKDPTFFKGAEDKSDRLLFTLMVNRPKSEKADAVPITAWGASARAGATHIKKGKTLLVEGRISTHFNSETKVNHFQVNAESIEYGPDSIKGKVEQAVSEPTDKLAAKLAARAKTPSVSLAEKKADLIEKLVDKEGLTFAAAKELAADWEKEQLGKAAPKAAATTTATAETVEAPVAEVDCPF